MFLSGKLNLRQSTVAWILLNKLSNRYVKDNCTSWRAGIAKTNHDMKTALTNSE